MNLRVVYIRVKTLHWSGKKKSQKDNYIVTEIFFQTFEYIGL